MNHRTSNTPLARICAFENCGKTIHARGHCAGHYQQIKRGIPLKPLILRAAPLEVQFWAKVDKRGPEECWNWVAHLNDFGYGRINTGQKLTLAHRLSYEWANGHISEDKVIDHTCHNPACVNPAHLREVTMKQNSENRFGAQKDSVTGFRGVYPRKNKGDFIAQVRHYGKTYYLGLFPTAEDANAAAIAKRIALYTHNERDRQVH